MSPSSSVATSRLLTVVLVALVVVVLYAAQAVLLPFAFAVLLSFLLSPVAAVLERFRLPRAAAVTIVAALVFLFLAGVMWVMVDQVIDLANELPKYEDNLRDKLDSVKRPWADTVSRAQETLSDLKNGLESEEATASTSPASQDMPRAPAAGAPAEPIVAPPARGDAWTLIDWYKTYDARRAADTLAAEGGLPKSLVEPPFSLVEIVTNWLGPMLAPLATAGIVSVLAIFMMAQREDLRNRFLRLFGEGQLRATTHAIDDAASRVARYLRMQLLINTIYGVAVGGALLLVGLPNALLWGLLGIILRFIPFLGPWVAAGISSLMAIAVFDGWTMPLVVIGMFIVLELLLNNVIEPWLYGSSTGISTIGIIVSAVFWTWLWGAVGLVLATPLTVCVVVLGRHVPQLRFLTILLSDEEVLPPAAQVYQRWLASDQEEALKIVEDYLKKHPREALYDAVLLPALALAEHDRLRGDMTAEDAEFVYGAAEDLISDLAERPLAETSGADEPAAAADRPKPLAVLRVACVSSMARADDLACLMLADLLRDRGHAIDLISSRKLASERVEAVAEGAYDVVVVSAVMPHSAQRASYLCKRIRAAHTSCKLLAGLWPASSDIDWAVERMKRAAVDRTAVSLVEAIDQTQRWASSMTVTAPVPAHA